MREGEGVSLVESFKGKVIVGDCCRGWFLSMDIWQPFTASWREIIAHVAEVHIAIINSTMVVLSNHWNKLPIPITLPPPQYSPSILLSSVVDQVLIPPSPIHGLGNGTMNVVASWHNPRRKIRTTAGSAAVTIDLI